MQPLINRKNNTKLFALLGAVVCALAVQPAKADVTWTASGSGSDGALKAQADFTISNGQIKVTITNTLALASLNSVGQSVSDLQFTLSNAPGTVGTNTATGQQVNVDSSGNVTFVSGTPDRWISSSTGGFNITGNTILLEAIGHGQPDELIIPGGVANGGKYPSTNPGFDAHNPYTEGPAVFTLNLSGVTTSTTISNVIFSFGTGPDTFINGVQTSAVPEPSSLILLGGVTCLISRKLLKKLA